MTIKRLSLWLGLLAFGCAGSVYAVDAPSLLKKPTPEALITAKLAQAIPQFEVTSVRPSPIEGLYLVQIGGSDILVTADGSKFIQGDIFDVKTTGFVKWEDPVLVKERKQMLTKVNPAETINFKPAKTKAVLYVFTDVDCGYCRKLNNEMADYNKLGIEIRYLAFPRAGIPSPSADKLITAWCSKDKQGVLTKVKEGIDVPNLTCANPIAAQFAMGNRLGVNSTPALWFPDGSIRPGYIPPCALAKELGIL